MLVFRFICLIETPAGSDSAFPNPQRDSESVLFVAGSYLNPEFKEGVGVAEKPSPRDLLGCIQAEPVRIDHLG